MNEKEFRLSYDKAFGILTRQALEIELEDMKKFDCCFIDFHNMRSFNRLLGYKKVNEIIHAIFDEFKTQGNFIIGRWFSGDEILITGEVNRGTLAIFREIAHKYGLSFHG